MSVNKVSKFDKIIVWLIAILIIETSIWYYIMDLNISSPFYNKFHYIFDLIICTFFLYDFFWLRLKKSNNKLSFFTFNFLDFIASLPELLFVFVATIVIPLPPEASSIIPGASVVFMNNPDLIELKEQASVNAVGLRFVKILLVFRIFRLGKGMIYFLKSSLKRKGWTLRLAAQLSIMVMFVSSVGLFLLEGARDPNSHFSNFADCFWWSAYTMATIGYEGAEMPVTVLGQLLSLILCGVGIALIGVFTATIVDLFVEDDKTNKRLDDIEAKIDNIVDKIDKKNNKN